MSDKTNLIKYIILPYDEYKTLKEGSETPYGRDIFKILNSELLTDQEKISQILNIITNYLETNKSKLKGKHEINNESEPKRDLHESDGLNAESNIPKVDGTSLPKASEDEWNKDISSEGISPEENTTISNKIPDVEIEKKNHPQEETPKRTHDKLESQQSKKSSKGKKMKSQDKTAISQKNVLSSKTRSQTDVSKARKKWLKY